MNIFEILIIIFGMGILLHLRKTAKNSATRETRLTRIKNASLFLQALTVASFPLGIYWLLAFFFGWHFFGQNSPRVVASPNHLYASPAEMPSNILALWSIRMALAFICYGVMFCLFRLYQKGILFSAKNVRYIYTLASYLIADWLLDNQIQSSLHDVALSTTPLFVALLVIFVAWVMDEGRKMKEEQELTV